MIKNNIYKLTICTYFSLGYV